MKRTRKMEIERLEDEVDRVGVELAGALEDLREERYLRGVEDAKHAREVREARDHALCLERELELAQRQIFDLLGVARFLYDGLQREAAAFEDLRVEVCLRDGKDPYELDAEDAADALRVQEEAARAAG